MRSSWIDRMFRPAHGSGQAFNLLHGNSATFSTPAAGKVRGSSASCATPLAKHARICLGIGDGRVHRQ